MKSKTENIALIQPKLSSQNIAESESLFRHILEQAKDPVLILKGKNLVLELANAAVYTAWNVGPEVLGSPILEIVPELDDQPFMDALLGVLHNGVTSYGYNQPAHFMRRKKEDITLFYNFVYEPYREEDRSISGVIISASDASDQDIYLQVIQNNRGFTSLFPGLKQTSSLSKKNSPQNKLMESEVPSNNSPNLNSEQLRAIELEEKVVERTIELIKANKALHQKNQEIIESKGKLFSVYARSLIEASLDPLITISTEGKITDVNKAMAKITGVSRQKLIDTDFSIYFTEPAKAIEVYKEVFAKGFVTNYPLTIIDGKLTEVLFNGSLYKDEQGKVLGAVVVARDITEQKAIEKEFIKAKVFAELAAGMAEEAKRNAESATLIAEDALKAKQQFLSNMSHEIRTPMNAIIGFTKVVLKTELSDKQKEYLSAIKISGDTLIVLINDILDLAKVDAGKMTFELTPFRMASSISAMLHLFEAKIQEKNLELIKIYDPEIPEILLGDPVRLHQIILNLVGNAVKFTSKGRISISVRMLHENHESATIEFSITDTGLGIAPNKLESIFENFQQASSSTSRLYGGTGLGLAIAKQLVEKQGGSISVVSELDKGSTFSFVLSFQKTTEETAIEIPLTELDTDIKNIKILVVEDMPLNQLLMKTVLDDFGFERDIAANGKIAIEKMLLKSYDVILMDLQMPVMNGFEATEYIRNTLHSRVPIIALTADVTTVDLAKCKAVGMNDYIAKPIDERLLYSKIIGVVKKNTFNTVPKVLENDLHKKIKCTDLEYLIQRTKNDNGMIMEMITAYLEQTPPLILSMKLSLQNKDWDALYAAVHKIIPSFLIMGISPDFESMAKKVQEYARTQLLTDGISDMVSQLENVCVQACQELEEELKRIKNSRP
jgi:PAS domain S-box-containing protein